MRTLPSSSAKARFAEILDDVERGETVIITRHGRPVARIVPEAGRRRAEIARAVQAIQVIGKRNGRVTVEDLLSARDEGRRSYFMPFVVDASVCGCWAFDDEDHPVAAQALQRLTAEDAAAPSLWWFEVRNLLLVNERRGRISQDDVSAFLSWLTLLPIVLDQEPDEARVLALARAHRLSVYDAAYLELAQRTGAALATLDKALAAAARAEGVAVA